MFNDEDGREREQVTFDSPEDTRRGNGLTEPSRNRDSRCVSHRVKFSRKAVHPSAHFAADHAPHPGNKVFYFDLQLNRPIHTYPAGTYNPHERTKK